MPAEAHRIVAGPVWREAEEEGEVWTAEVQTVGGHYVIAAVHGGSQAEAAARQATVIAALATPPAQPAGREGDNALYRKLRSKLGRVHHSNAGPNVVVRIELTMGEIARCSTAILALTPPAPDVRALREAVDALKWANDRLRECGKHTDFTLGLCLTLSDSEKREEAARSALAREVGQSK